jgi:hypothetical protein
MIRADLDPEHKRVLVRDQRNILGELIYQVETETGWCDAVTLSEKPSRVTVVLRGGVASSAREVEIVDEFEAGEGLLRIRRTWTYHTAGGYRPGFDYRLRTASEGVVLPSHTASTASAHLLRSPLTVPAERLSAPLILFHGTGFSQAIAFNLGEQEAASAAVECFQSEGFPALRVQTPHPRPAHDTPQFLSVGRRELPFVQTMSYTIFIARDEPLSVLGRGLGEAWSSAPAGGPVAWPEVVDLREQYLFSHVRREERGPAGVVPAGDRRPGKGPSVYAATAPYWSLEAARVLVYSGLRTGHTDYLIQAADIADFFCGGRQPDGSFCDAFEPERGFWGSIPPGEEVLVRGSSRLPHAGEAGLRLIWLYERLRAQGMEMPRLARVATDIAHYHIHHQQDDGGYAAAPCPPGSGAAVVSLICALQRVRGRNSVRAASLRRAASWLNDTMTTPDRAIAVVGSRGAAFRVLRAALDLLDAGYAECERATRIAGDALLSWVYSRDLVFPQRSAAGRHGVRTTGLPVVGASRAHLDFEGFPIARELLRLSRAAGADLPLRVARTMLSAGAQLVGGLDLRSSARGYQPAELDFVSWSAIRRFGSAAGRVGGSRIGQAGLSLAALYEIAELFPGEVELSETLNSRSSRS